MEQRIIDVNGVKLANNLPFGLLCGPCQIESRQHAIDIAGAMVEITKELNIPYISRRRLTRRTALPFTARAASGWKRECVLLTRLKALQ